MSSASPSEDLSQDPSPDDIIRESPDSATIFDTQRLWMRRWIFWAALAVCSILYLTFLGMVAFFIWDSDMRIAILAHPHLMTLLLALLIIPSFILWGIVRSVYKLDQESESLTSVIGKCLQEWIKAHPLR